MLIVDLRLNIDMRNVGVRESGYLFEEYNKIVLEFLLYCFSILNENIFF